MKLTHRETADLCRGLSLLLHSGISLSDGVFLLAQEQSGELRDLLNAIGREMDMGIALSQAARESGAFPFQVPGMMAVGERTGKMEEALGNLAAFYHQRERTNHQIKTALTYPGILLVLMLMVITVLLTKVLPVFDRVYASLGSGLTGFSGVLLGLGQGLEKAMPVLLVFLGTLVLAALVLTGCPGIREKAAAGFIRRFGDRGMFRKFNNARFVRSLAMGISSGLPLEEALTLAKELLWDVPQAAKRCEACIRGLSEGGDLVQSMTGAELLPPRESRLLSVGLRSGSADRVLEDMAQRMEEDAQEHLERLVARIEPAMVLVCSGLVGVILLAVMLPLMNILSAMG